MKGIGEKFPVQSVNNKTGIVSLDYDDVNAPSTTETNASGTWNINAKTASKLITTFQPTSRTDNVAGYRLIGTSNAGTWNNKREVWCVASRHTGCGMLSFCWGHNASDTTVNNAYGNIAYHGATTGGSVIYEDSFQIYYNASTTTFYLFWKYNDYNSTNIIQLNQGSQGGWTLSNGVDMDSISTATYGTLICQTTIG